MILKTLLEVLSDFIFPRFCEKCGNLSSSFLCLRCKPKIEFFNTTFRCRSCKKEIDVDDSICLSCKRGFFYPSNLFILFEKPIFSIQKITSEKAKILASLIVYFLHEKNIFQSFDYIKTNDSKLKEDALFLKNLSQALDCPIYRGKNTCGHLLIVHLTVKNSHELNKETLSYLKEGFEKVSFLCIFQDSISS